MPRHVEGVNNDNATTQIVKYNTRSQRHHTLTICFF